MRSLIVCLFLGGGFVLSQSFSPNALVEDKDDITYETTIRPIIANYCFSCHSGKMPSAGFSLDSYEKVRYQVEKGPLLKRINNPNDPMPMSGLMPKKERDAIMKWAENGYKEAPLRIDTVVTADRSLVTGLTDSVLRANINPIDVTKEGFLFFELMQGHWVGDLNIMGQQYDWFSFDYRPISATHVHGIYEGGSMGNLFTSFFVSNLNGRQTIMARNGGVLNGIYRTSYFVLDKVKLSEDRQYFRLVDAIGGKEIMYMELEFTGDKLVFKSYTSRFGANGKPRLHMRFEATKKHLEVAQSVAKVLHYPQNKSEKDFKNGLPNPTWEKQYGPVTSASYMHTAPNQDLSTLAELAGDPYTRDELPHLAVLKVNIEQNDLIKDKDLIIYLSKTPLTDKNGKILMEYGYIKQQNFDGVFHFPNLVANETSFTFNYLHPGEYYIVLVADKNKDGYISKGDITTPSQKIVIKPEEQQEMNLTNVHIQN